jgi:hypothetical protein
MSRWSLIGFSDWANAMRSTGMSEVPWWMSRPVTYKPAKPAHGGVVPPSPSSALAVRASSINHLISKYLTSNS